MVYLCAVSPRFKAYLQIHTAVILFGFTGILGDLISLNKPTLVFWRFGLTVCSLLLIPGLVKSALQLNRKDVMVLFGIGGLVAAHWIFFFLSIAWTNVSVALSVFATTTFFTSFLEPMVMKRPFRWYEMAIGLLVIPGVALVAGTSTFPFTGIIFALIAAFLAALFSTLNKRVVARVSPMPMTLVQLTGGWIVAAVWVLFYHLIWPELPFMPVDTDWVYLGLLAFLCTSFAYVISLQSLQVLSAFSVNLTVNLEPIYSIILANFILAEHKELNWGFYPGAAIIIISVFLHPMISNYFKKRENEPKSTIVDGNS